MIKVWVVSENWGYDGISILGVVRAGSEEQAIEYGIKHLSNKSTPDSVSIIAQEFKVHTAKS